MDRRSERRLVQPWFFWLVLPCFLLPFFAFAAPQCNVKGEPDPPSEEVSMTGVDLLIGGEPTVERQAPPGEDPGTSVAARASDLGPQPWAWVALLAAMAGATVSVSSSGWRVGASILAAAVGVTSLIGLGLVVGLFVAEERIGFSLALGLFGLALVNGIMWPVYRAIFGFREDPPAE